MRTDKTSHFPLNPICIPSLCCSFSASFCSSLNKLASHISFSVHANSYAGERVLTPALPLSHSFRNSFHSATPWALRRSAVTGSSFGARGTLSSFRPASCGRRLPLRVFTSLLDHTRFSHVSAPPRE